MIQKCNFIGVFAQVEEQAKGLIMDAIQIALSQIEVKFKTSIQIDKFKWPDTIHMTTLFIKNNHVRNSKQVQQFTLGDNHNLIIHGFAINNHIITCILDKKDYTIEIANEYPHITALINDWKPFKSNELLTSIFAQFKEDVTKQQDGCFQIGDAFVVLLKDKLIIPGVTGCH